MTQETLSCPELAASVARESKPPGKPHPCRMQIPLKLVAEMCKAIIELKTLLFLPGG